LDIDDSHYTTVVNCQFIAENATTGANNAITIDASNFCRIEKNVITGDYAESAIHTASSDAVSKAIVIDGNQIYNDDTASTMGGGIHFPVANTGIISNNNIAHLNDDEGDIIIDPGSCLLMNNLTCTKIDTYGIDTLVGTASS
jgi:hypothetical protein